MGQEEILEYLKKRDRWVTRKELIDTFGIRGPVSVIRLEHWDLVERKFIRKVGASWRATKGEKE